MLHRRRERACKSTPARVALAVGWLAAACSAGVFGPGRSLACEAYAPPNEVLRTVELRAAREYRAALPALGAQAKLETDLPAVLVVFDGPMRDTEIRAGSAPATGSRLKHVCVVFGDGSTYLYLNVDVGHLVPPAGGVPDGP